MKRLTDSLAWRHCLADVKKLGLDFKKNERGEEDIRQVLTSLCRSVPPELLTMMHVPHHTR